MNPILIHRWSTGCNRGADAAAPFIPCRRGAAGSNPKGQSPGLISRLSAIPTIRFPIAFVAGFLCQIGTLKAVNTVLFDASQKIDLTAAGTTSDTFVTRGYRIKVTRDKLFTGGISSTPIGRNLRVLWPAGMEVQGVTSGPVQSKAILMIERVDGQTFSVNAFTLKLLANTFGAGGSVEVMPLIDGEDGLPDPVAFDVTGFYNMSYSFSPTQFNGKGYNSYKFVLYADYAITSLTLTDPSQPAPAPPKPMLTMLSATDAKISWPVSAYDYTLQTSTDLKTGSWVANYGHPVVESGFNVVYFTASDPCRFFRLSN